MQKVRSQIEIHDSINLFKNEKEIIDPHNETKLQSHHNINVKTKGQQVHNSKAFQVKRSLSGINNTQKKYPEGILKASKVYQEDNPLNEEFDSSVK